MFVTMSLNDNAVGISMAVPSKGNLPRSTPGVKWLPDHSVAWISLSEIGFKIALALTAKYFDERRNGVILKDLKQGSKITPLRED